MEFSSLVDTSLDLNIRPFRVLDEALKQEVQSNFIDLGPKPPVNEETGALVEELNRVSAENKKLTEMLTVLCENYNSLRNQVVEYMSKVNNAQQNQQQEQQPESSSGSRKRKSDSNIENNNANINNNIGPSESSSSDEAGSFKKQREEQVKSKVSRVYFRTEPSDTSLIVKDGYQWRKYGQKVTRDNPSPRAYFKCSFAPTCPVKKKVQRSVEDQLILVATYDGEHTHPHPNSKMDTSSSSPPSNKCVAVSSVPCSTSVTFSGPTITLDLTKPSTSAKKPQEEASHIPTAATATATAQRVNSPEFQSFLIEQMASSLTKDPSFKAALAAAISGKILQGNLADSKW